MASFSLCYYGRMRLCWVCHEPVISSSMVKLPILVWRSCYLHERLDWWNTMETKKRTVIDSRTRSSFISGSEYGKQPPPVHLWYQTREPTLLLPQRLNNTPMVSAILPIISLSIDLLWRWSKSTIKDTTTTFIQTTPLWGCRVHWISYDSAAGRLRSWSESIIWEDFKLMDRLY